MKLSHPNIDYLGKCTLVYPSDPQTRIAVGAVEMYEPAHPATPKPTPKSPKRPAPVARRDPVRHGRVVGMVVVGGWWWWWRWRW